MNTHTPQDKDPQLWEIAQRRASFKYHLAAYIIVNIFFWILWFITEDNKSDDSWPWPIWPMFGWGIGLTFHFLGAYVFPKNNSVEREYEKLKREQEQTN